MAEQDVFEFSAKYDIELEKSAMDRACKILDDFYKKYSNRKMKIDTKDMVKTAQGGISAIQKLYEQGLGEAAKGNTSWWQIEDNVEDQLVGARAQIKDFFRDAKLLFSDGSVVGALDENLFGELTEKFQNGITVAAVDLGERVQYLKQHITDAIGELKNISAVETTWSGSVFGFSGDDMSESQLEKRIDLLKELLQNQRELEVFNGGKFKQEDAPAMMTSQSLSYSIGHLEDRLTQMQEYNSQVEEQYKLTTKQFKRRQALIDSSSDKSWFEDDQAKALKNIDDEDEYDRAISNLRYYIESRRNLIDELRSSEYELFRADGIDQYVKKVETQIEEYENNIKELESAKKGNQDTPIVSGNLSEVVEQLKEIKDAITAIKTAFDPLTNALSAEDNALHKMLTTSIEDLNTLESRLKDVYQMIDTISKKEFTSTTTSVISNGSTSSAQADLELIRQLRKEARDTYKQVEQLHIEALGETGSVLVKSGHTNSILKLQEMMSDFNLEDLSKRTKSRSAASLAVVLDELNEWKAILLQFNELRNRVIPGSFDASKYPAVQAKPVSDDVKTVEDEIVDDSVVESNDILTKVKTLSEQIESELTSIRSKMEETFDLSTIDPKIENVKNITDAIYQQFVELQAKINALDLNLGTSAIAVKTDGANNDSFAGANKNVGDVSTETSKSVDAAAEAIKQEGNEAEIAAQKKREFVEANKAVANSGEATKSGVKEATDAIKEEGDVAEDSAKRIAMAQQAVSNFNNANQANIGDVVKLKGLSQADFEEYASEIAKSKGLKVGDIAVSIGENGNMMVASVQMLNEELAQSITYTYTLKKLEEDVVEAYLTGYRAKGNQNKALKIAAAEQKKADAERLKADKERAKNNQWLIKQQSKLDTQERRYKHSNKSIDGSTALMSTETSLADDTDKTIDSLAKHIRDRIQSAVGSTLTDDLREEILNDIRILQNEIAVAQNDKYSATNMKASSVTTSVDAYKEYLRAFEANAKKANVFEQMKGDIAELRKELGKVEDSAGLDAFIDKLKIARNKLTAEKAKYAQETQESKQNEQAYDNAIKAQEKLYNLKKKMVELDPQSSKGQETMRKLIEAQKEYNDVLAETKNLTIGQRASIKSLETQQEAELSTLRQEYKSNVSAEQEAKDLEYVLSLYKKYTDAERALKKIQSDTTGATHTAKEAAAIEDIQNAKADLLSLGIDVNNISESELLTEKQKNALLEEQVKHKKQIRDIENASSDKAATKENKQNQNYGKVVYNREARYFDTIGAKTSSLASETTLSDDFLAKLEKYKIAFKELEDLRDQFARNPDAFNNEALKGKFQETTLTVEGLRKAILATFKESQKFEAIPDSALFGHMTLDADQLKDVRSAMIEYASAVTDGRFQLDHFNSTGTEMYGVINKGGGVLEQVAVKLREGTNQIYAFQSGTKQVTSSWQKLGGALKSGVKQLVGMYFGVHEAVQAVRQGLTYVKDIDLALTELKKVTDETDATYKEFLQTASSTSSIIGSTISDFTDATAAFARLGYSIDESTKMAETAIVYKNVADGLDTVEESTDSIISTMMAYGIEADNTMSIIDRFNAVGNNFAITSAGIGEAMQRSASALYEGGNTIDESIALITAANSVIQDPMQVGTAMKTLSLRIRGVKTELEEAGLETEGMAETTAQLQAKLKALTHGKVDIMLNADEFKSTTQILREMSAAWQDMTDVEQAAALELIGGKRQAKRKNCPNVQKCA